MDIHISIGSFYIIFKPYNDYNTTFIDTNLPNNFITKLFKDIKSAVNGNLYLPFVVENVTHGLVHYNEMCELDFDITIKGIFKNKNVTYVCPPIKINHNYENN